MQTRRFGKTGLDLSVFTFGAMNIPGVPEEQALATCEAAFKAGLNHFETARWYGTSEALLGKAFKQGLVDRSRIVLTTKIGPTKTADEMARAIDESLTRMGVSVIDNFDLHGINTAGLLARAVDEANCFAAVRKARDEGKIRNVGFSTHAPLEVILAAMRTDLFSSVNLHFYYFNQRNRAAVDLAAEKDMGVLIISPADKGGQLYAAPEKLARLTAPLSPLVFNARWCLQFPQVTTLTLGAKHPGEFAAHLAAAGLDGPPTPDERRIDAGLQAEARARLGATLCTQCYACLPCPQDIQIPETLRLRNLALAYDMTGFGTYRYKMFENASHWFPGKKATACNDCGDCLPRCPEKLAIPALLRETHDLLFTGEEGKRKWATSGNDPG
jgi:predicted aldo/keto reductase-like oxidoreductase